jgi:Histidine kinase
MRWMRQWLSAAAWGALLLALTFAWSWAPGERRQGLGQVSAAQMRQGTTDWIPLDAALLADWTGPFEIRWTLTLSPQTAAAAGTLALRLSLRAASELRIDGQTLLLNGRVAERAEDETPGLVDRWVTLPPLSEGEHLVWVRASNHRIMPGTFSTAEARIVVLPLEQLPRLRYGRWMVLATAWGALALVCCYFAGRGGGDQPAHRVGLIALGAIALVLPLAEASRDLFGYHYPWHVVRMRVILLGTAAAAWLLPVTLALRWGWPKHWVGRPALATLAWAVVLGLLARLIRGYDPATYALQMAGLVGALLVTWWARHRAQELLQPLLVLLLTALALLLLDAAALLDGLYALALALVMTMLMLGHVRQQESWALAQAGQREALQARLLRTAIQPHGLMNTLTVLQELIERRPALASQFVDRLADHFSLLRGMSERPLVLLREEIALCQSQLDIVALARETTLPLTVSGPLDGLQLPPGVLHTLVENAVTHGGIQPGAAPFELQVQGHAKGWRLQLTSPRGAGRFGDPAGPGGQGQRFVRESLALAYRSGSAYESGALGERRWLDVLILPR